MRRTERAAYRTKFYSNLSSPTRFDEEPSIFHLILNRLRHFLAWGPTSLSTKRIFKLR